MWLTDRDSGWSKVERGTDGRTGVDKKMESLRGWTRQHVFVLFLSLFPYRHPPSQSSTGQISQNTFFPTRYAKYIFHGIDDKAYVSDPHWLAPGGPPTHRDLASNPWTSSPVEKHSMLQPILHARHVSYLHLLTASTRVKPRTGPLPSQRHGAIAIRRHRARQ